MPAQFPSFNDREYDLLKKLVNNTGEGGGGGGDVASVNGQTGVVVLDAADVGAAPIFPSFSLSNIIWVTKGGNDTTGDGSEAAPYLTITKALSVIPVLNGGTSYLINVGPGAYITGPDAALTWRSHIYMRGSCKAADSPQIGGLTILTDASAHIYCAFDTIELGAVNAAVSNERQLDFINCRMGNIAFNIPSSTPTRPVRFINCFSYSSQIPDMACDSADFYGYFGKLHLGHDFDTNFAFRLFGCDLTLLEIQDPNSAPFRTNVEVRGSHIDVVTVDGDRIDAYFDPNSITTTIGTTGAPNIVYLSPPGRVRRVTSQFDKTNTTLADITGLSLPLVAGQSVRFRAVLFTTSNVGGGVKAAMAYSGTVTNIIYEGFTASGGVLTQTRASASGTAVGAITAVTAATIIIEGSIVANAAGNLTVQFAENAATATSSVLVGSYLEILGFGS